MNKVILAIIVLIVLALAAGILYFLFSGGSPKTDSTTTTTTQTTTTDSNNFTIQGMKVEILAEGSGNAAKAGDSVTVNYVGTLEDGKQFDSSIDKNTPFTFRLGQGVVIKGWDLGIIGMKVGEKRRLTIPAELGYGANGFPPVIPPNAKLIFNVVLEKIN